MFVMRVLRNRDSFVLLTFVAPADWPAKLMAPALLRARRTMKRTQAVPAAREPYGEPRTFDLLPAGGTGRYWVNGVLLGSTLNPRVHPMGRAFVVVGRTTLLGGG
jgi:hypothetical protein